MRIKIQQFLTGNLHSWREVGLSIGREFLKLGHEVDFVSTDGIKKEFVPQDIEPFLKKEPVGIYDMQLSYTAMINFKKYLANGTKNRFGIWNFEWDVLPQNWAKLAYDCDKFLPSSKFFYDVCVKNKIKSDAMEVVQHGVDYNKFHNAQPMKLKTNKKHKILVNFAQPHMRKNIPGTLECFGRAFSKKDDVCLVLKVVDKKPQYPWELQFSNEWTKFKKKFPNHAEVIILPNYIPAIEELYQACDVFFMIPHAEAFFLPALQFLATHKPVITSRYGGMVDYLDDNNSILVDGKIERAPRESVYWNAGLCSHFIPNLDDAANKLISVVQNYDSVKEKLSAGLDMKLFEHFSWESAAKKIIGLCND